MPKWTVEAVNKRLGASKVKIRQRGHSLYLRATLPPQAGENKPKQRDLPIARASVAGLQFAEERAHELEAEILEWKRAGRFDWAKWLQLSPQPPSNTTGAKIAEFRDWYLQRKNITDDTWKRHWFRYLKRLNQEVEPSEADLMRVVWTTEPDTRNRRRCCQVLAKFAEFLDISTDLSPFKGSYSVQKSKILKVPTAEEMLDIVGTFENERWRNYLALQVVFGLRPHEPHYSQYDPETRTCNVLDGKTGKRVAYPLYNEWIERLEISEDMLMPKISCKDFSDASARAWQAYRREKFPNVPRIPRYVYVVDAVCVQELPIPAVAASTGHSATTLLSVYSRYINAATMKRVFERKNLP